jgi:hypothetical protein
LDEAERSLAFQQPESLKRRRYSISHTPAGVDSEASGVLPLSDKAFMATLQPG